MPKLIRKIRQLYVVLLHVSWTDRRCCSLEAPINEFDIGIYAPEQIAQ